MTATTGHNDSKNSRDDHNFLDQKLDLTGSPFCSSRSPGFDSNHGHVNIYVVCACICIVVVVAFVLRIKHDRTDLRWILMDRGKREGLETYAHACAG